MKTKNTKYPTVKAAFILLGFLSACPVITNAALDDTPSSTTTSPIVKSDLSTLTPKEIEFAQKAALGGIFEVKLGKIAQTNGHSPEIKQFGLTMMADHGKINEELQSLITKKGGSLPISLDTQHQLVVATLSKLQGKAFDKVYVTEMVKDHKNNLVEFKEIAVTSTDPDLKAFAEKNSNIVADHLATIKNIQDKM